jgi:Tfp pilus assembly PilM family ATPase
MRTEDELCIEKIFSTQTRRSKDSPLEILRRLSSKHGFDRRSDVAISMPHDAVFFRNLETDFTGLEHIRQAPKSALAHNIPIEQDEIIAQACSHRQLPDDKYSVLTAAVSKTSLRERLNILAGAKIHPNLVETAIFAIHSTIATNHPEIATGQAIIAYIDESYLTLAVTENKSCWHAKRKLRGKKYLVPILSKRLKFTWQSEEMFPVTSKRQLKKACTAK